MPLIKNEEGKCPHCDNEYKLEYDDYHITTYSDGYYYIHCPFCGFEGKEHRTLQFKKITNIDDSEVIGWANENVCQYCGKAGGH